MSEWVAWHQGYAPGSQLAQRLEVVQRMLREALDAAPPGPLRLVSMCAGDGRDVIGVLQRHRRAADVSARLVELDPELAQSAVDAARLAALDNIEVRRADAGNSDAYAGSVPAEIVMMCGVFGNITDSDVRNTVSHAAELCADGAAVIWTRGTFAPDLTPTIREWFAEGGFEELDYVRIPDTTASIGMHRLAVPPRQFVPAVRLFTFLPPEQRPSRQGT